MKLANTQLFEDVLITKAKLKVEGERKNIVRKKSNDDQSKNKLTDTHTDTYIHIKPLKIMLWNQQRELISTRQTSHVHNNIDPNRKRVRCTWHANSNSNSKTLFYKDCSLGLVKNLSNNLSLLSC